MEFRIFFTFIQQHNTAIRGEDSGKCGFLTEKVPENDKMISLFNPLHLWRFVS